MKGWICCICLSPREVLSQSLDSHVFLEATAHRHPLEYSVQSCILARRGPLPEPWWREVNHGKPEAHRLQGWLPGGSQQINPWHGDATR